jgi:hypothetical protein
VYFHENNPDKSMNIIMIGILNAFNILLFLFNLFSYVSLNIMIVICFIFSLISLYLSIDMKKQITHKNKIL